MACGLASNRVKVVSRGLVVLSSPDCPRSWVFFRCPGFLAAAAVREQVNLGKSMGEEEQSSINVPAFPEAHQGRIRKVSLAELHWMAYLLFGSCSPSCSPVTSSPITVDRSCVALRACAWWALSLPTVLAQRRPEQHRSPKVRTGTNHHDRQPGWPS